MSHIHFGDADKKQGPQLPLNGTGKSKNSRSLASPGQYSNTNGGTPPRKKFKKDHARSSHNTQPNGVGSHKKAVNGVLKHKPSRSFNQEQDGAWTPIQKQREELPIWAGKDALIQQIRENDTVVILGETGSGKTTQVPQFLLEAGFAKDAMIGVTQTRRVAATSIAQRVALEQGTKVGDLVGYSVRFEEASSSDTKIKFLTDGMLVRELMMDPLLSGYSVIIVDEAHERTLRTDLLLSRLKDIQRIRNQSPDKKGKRPASETRPLKVVIMSATLDAEKFSAYFNGAKIVYVQGRQYPVKIYYTSEPQQDFLEAGLKTFFQLHKEKMEGDVLIFLPGQEDIESLEKSIKEYSSQLRKHDTRILVCPLYAALPMSHQTQVFALTPPDTRKCILATNIAETAITIPGIRHVIDSGKYKEKMYSTTFKSAMEALITKSISKASAMQRAGRAGREGPGTCFRLYTEEGFRSLRESSTPEIQRSNLASSILQLKYLNQDPETVDWMDSPGRDALEAALITLFAIQAIDRTRALTPLGRLMASFPVEPSLARAILASREQNCSNEVVDIVAVLSTTSTIFFDPSEAREDASEARRKFRHPTGDHIMFLNLFRAYEEVLGSLGRHGAIDWCRKHYINERALAEAVRIRDQIRSSCERLNINWKTSSRLEPEPILKSFLAGSPQNAAQLHPDFDYRQLIGSSVVKIHPSSTLIDKKVPVIMYNELIITSKIYARCVSSITRQFITELPLYSQTPSRTT